jgi:hypothetical protein
MEEKQSTSDKAAAEEKALAFGGKVSASPPSEARKADEKRAEDEEKKSSELQIEGGLPDKLRARMFPRIFDRKCDSFIFRGCSFRMQGSKASTMRIVM